MKIKETLRNLRDYIAATRQVGHTTAMIRGAQNVDSVIVLAHTQHHAALLQKQLPNATVKAITNPTAVIGMNKPLVVDNATLWEICGGALAEIERLEHRIEELSKANALTLAHEPEEGHR